MATIIEKKPRWYVAYTKSRNERKVSDRLKEKGIEHYLPLHKVLKQWSDRKKWVEEAVFKSYIFIRIGLDDYYDVLNTEGVVAFVRIGTYPEPVPDRQVLAVRKMLESDYELEINITDYDLGDSVQVIKGPMEGFIGNILEEQGKHKFAIHLEVIGQSVAMTIPKSHLRKLNEREEQLQKSKLQKRLLSGDS
jgi:transcriptional antiterminator RfaH